MEYQDKDQKQRQAWIKLIEKEIRAKAISLDYFWRNVMHMMRTEHEEYTGSARTTCEHIKDMMVAGMPFELIDGDNLDFKGDLFQKVFTGDFREKVMVVAVVGPQSSGKSTLMNYAFGTQFITSAGRCTSGVYFTLQRLPGHMLNNENEVKWVLMLDTEGLLSPENQYSSDTRDAEFDRKVLLFALLASDLLIINSQGEIDQKMSELLQICTVGYDRLRPVGKTPDLIYSYNQVATADTKNFDDGLQKIKSGLLAQDGIELSSTIRGIAEEILHFDPKSDQLVVFAGAFAAIHFNVGAGARDEKTINLNNPAFASKTSKLLGIIDEKINTPGVRFNELPQWLESAEANWNLIDKFTADLAAFANLDEMTANSQIKKKLQELLSDFLEKIRDSSEHEVTKLRRDLEAEFSKGSDKQARTELVNMVNRYDEYILTRFR